MGAIDLSKLSLADANKYLRTLHEVERLSCEESLAQFVRSAWHVLEPSTPLLWNWHLDVLCGYLQALYDGRLRSRRLVINIPPGTAKSLVVSVFYPAWIWVQPDSGASESFLNLTNAGDLATRDTMRMRSLVQSEWYQRYWRSRVSLSPDQREKTHFANTKHGFRIGQGINASVTGKRVSTLIIDDPHDAKRALGDTEVQSVCQSYDQAVSSRLKDPRHGTIILIMQRLRNNDLTGHLLDKKDQDWVHVKIPMTYTGSPGYDPLIDIGPEAAKLSDPRRKVGETLMPARFDKAWLKEARENLGEYGWAGQMQQDPVPMGGGIIKAKWWQRWPQGRELPKVQHVFCSWDTAYTEKDTASGSYSAMTAWGIFWSEEKDRHCLLLLAAWWGRVSYPDLRAKAKEEESKRKPDCHLIEAKASGQSLIQDLRRGKVGVRGYDPRPDGDKVGRAALASSSFEAGLIWAPSTAWADQVIRFTGEIPLGAPPSGDIGDTVTQAVRYLTKRWWITHPDDDENEPNTPSLLIDDEDDDAITPTRFGVYG